MAKRKRYSRISEALKVLEEAAGEEGGELHRFVSDKYVGLREALGKYAADAEPTIKRAKRKVAKAFDAAKESGEEKVSEFAKAVDERVHEKPWTFIGGVAAVGFVFGYLLGRK